MSDITMVSGRPPKSGYEVKTTGSGGGGTEYAQGDVVATPVGTAMMGRQTSTNEEKQIAVTSEGYVQISTTASVPINDDGGSITVDGAVSVDDGGGSLTVDNSGTFAVQENGAALTSLQLIDDAIGTTSAAIPTKAMVVGISDGTNVQIPRAISATLNTASLGIQAAGLVAQLDDVLPTVITENQFGVVRMSQTRALRTGIYDAANNERGANVNALSELNVALAASATSVAKAEDTASADADVGIPAMAVRKATPANTSGTDGDYEMLQMSAGRLWTSTSVTGTVSSVGNVAHDAVGTSTNPLLQGGYASAAAPADVSADGDAVRAWRLRNGAAATVITAAGALVGGDATNGLDIDPTRPWPGNNLSGTAGSLNADAIASTDVSRYSGISVQVSGTWVGTLTVQVSNDNSTWFSLPLFDCATTVGAPYSGITGNSMSTGSFNFNFLRIRMTAYTSGTATVNATLQAQTKAPFTGGFYVFGQGAEGAAPTGSPVNISGRVRTALPSAASDGNILMPMLDKFGRAVSVMNSVRDLIANQYTALASGSETTIVTAAGASVFADIITIVLANTTASAITATIKDSTAGTTQLSVQVPANDTKQVDFASPLKQTTANNNWTATAASGLNISVVYAKNK